MESLNEIHQIIVENFLDRAKQQSQKARQTGILLKYGMADKQPDFDL